jgi:hypothetical protein
MIVSAPEARVEKTTAIVAEIENWCTGRFRRMI